MVTPALQLSVKMPENSLQVWAASLLAGIIILPPCDPVTHSLPVCPDLYRTLGQPEKEQVLRQQSSGVSSLLEEGGYILHPTPHTSPLPHSFYLYSTRQEKSGGQ